MNQLINSHMTISQPKEKWAGPVTVKLSQNKWDLINYPSNRDSQPKRSSLSKVTVKCPFAFDLINYNREMLSMFWHI